MEKHAKKWLTDPRACTCDYQLVGCAGQKPHQICEECGHCASPRFVSHRTVTADLLEALKRCGEFLIMGDREKALDATIQAIAKAEGGS